MSKQITGEDNRDASLILVTGGTGYLGGSFLRRESQFDFLCLYRDSARTFTAKNVKWIDFSELDRYRSKILGVLHLATNYGKNGESEKDIAEANVAFPTELIKTLSPSLRFFFNIDSSLPSDLSSYTKTKRQFRESLSHKKNILFIANVVLEYCYGPNDGHLIDFLYQKFKSNPDEIPLTIGTQKRDFIYLEDAVSALQLILVECVQRSSQGPGYWNIGLGSGVGTPVREAVETLRELLHMNSVVLNFGSIPLRDNEPLSLCADMTELSKLNWKPEFSLRAGLKDIVDKAKHA